MYVITGASGNTGSVIAKGLLAAGRKVRVVARSADRLAPLVALGAEAFAADLTDREATSRAFAGAQAAYAMIPPDLGIADFRAYQDKVTDNLASAIEANAVKHVVALSSIGADKPAKTGPIVGLRRLEERLKAISGVNVTSLRAGYFMENTLAQVGIVQQTGMVAGPLNPDLKVPMIATRDIGSFAGQLLLRLDFSGQQTVELLGQRDLTMLEATAVLGKAIGKPDLTYHQVSYEQFHGALTHMGISRSIADLYVEMSQSLNSGHVRALEARSAQNTTPTSYEKFVAEVFVPAFQGKSAAA